MGTLATRLAEIQQGLGTGFQGSGSGAPSDTRTPNPAVLIAASKTVPIPTLEHAISLGITNFGENKVQEAYEKWPALKATHPEIRLHLIGALQSNKAKEALALFDVIHTVDRPKLVDALVKEIQGAGVRGQSEEGTHHTFLIQVNTGSEPQKAGVLPEDLPALLNYCAEKGLTIAGLMCIPPAATPAAPHFALLKKLAGRHGLTELSMGMSSDYAVAARMGATMVRIGTALFGERQ